VITPSAQNKIAAFPLHSQNPANSSAVPVKIMPIPYSDSLLAEAVYPTMSNGLPPPLLLTAWICCCCTVNPNRPPAAGAAEVAGAAELVLVELLGAADG
jgi:hypothetical protein